MLNSRLKNVKKQLKENNLEGVLISSVSNITYLTGYVNFSKNEREAYLIVGEDFQYLITDARYSEAVKKEVAHFTLFERNHQNKIEDLLKSLQKRIKTLGIEEDNLTVVEQKMLNKYFKNLRHIEIGKHRAIKTAEEIKKIEQAAKLGDEAFKFILGKIKPGVSEQEIAFELEFFIKRNRAELSFPSIVAFGKNSAIPHHQTGGTILSDQAGQFVLLDFGVKYENYCSDMTRTMFFGKPSEKQKRIYETVLKAQQKAIDYIHSAIKSGKKVMTAKADEVARDYITSKDYPTIPHSLGHGIGLEVHEHPSLSPKAKKF